MATGRATVVVVAAVAVVVVVPGWCCHLLRCAEEGYDQDVLVSQLRGGVVTNATGGVWSSPHAPQMEKNER